MACGCKKSGATRRAMAVLPSSDRPASPGRTRVRFFVSPPPEAEGVEEAFSTVYQARAFLRQHPSWFLTSRRVDA